jgi:peptidoglycan lytic transglycosylase
MRFRLLALLLSLACFGAPVAAHAPAPHRSSDVVAREAPRHSSTQATKPLPKKQKGKASYYARSFTGKKMADGTRLNPASNAAASKTLPLGTKARVKNLDNGKVAVVEIRDRGPYVKGRIVDVTPGTAEQLGMKQDGVATVEVQPIAPPAEDKPTGQSRRVQ